MLCVFFVLGVSLKSSHIRDFFMNRMKKKFSEIEKFERSKYPDLRGCSKDGYLFPLNFILSRFKITFILKEPYEDFDEKNQRPVGNGLNYRCMAHNLEESGMRTNKTWKKVAAIAYALKNQCDYTETLSLKQMTEGLKCVNWINLSKTPWQKQTNENDAYKQRVKLWEPYVKEQMEHAPRSTIYYFGNTWDSTPINPVEPDKLWDSQKFKNEEKHKWTTTNGNCCFIKVSTYRNTKILVVNGYHPDFGKSPEETVTFIQKYKKMYNLE